MSAPPPRPQRKNPVLRTRLPTLPPGARSRVALGLTGAAARGRLELQVCSDCGAVQYPAARGVSSLPLRPVRVAAVQTARASSSPTRASISARSSISASARPGGWGWCGSIAAPPWWRMCMAIAPAPPVRVRVGERLDRAGQAVLVGAAGRRRSDHGRRQPLARDDLRPALPQGAGHRRQDRGRAGHRRQAGRGRRRDRVGRLCRTVEEIPRLRSAEDHPAGDAGAARRHRCASRCASLPARSASRSTSSSTPRNIIAPSASPRARASKWRAPRWT